jgi:hypothetical protein
MKSNLYCFVILLARVISNLFSQKQARYHWRKFQNCYSYNFLYSYENNYKTDQIGPNSKLLKTINYKLHERENVSMTQSSIVIS